MVPIPRRCAACRSSAPPPPDKPHELSQDKLRDDSPVRFLSRIGAATMDHPQFKSMLWVLFEQRPCAMSLSELTARVSAVSGSGDRRRCAGMAVYGHRTGIVGMHTRARRWSIASVSGSQPRRWRVGKCRWIRPSPTSGTSR